MITLKLSEEDAAVLARTLDWALSETRVEVIGTDTPNYREEIKAEQASLERIVANLRGSVSACHL